MCVIVVKNRGVKLPSKKTLQTCFDNNPDGAGFMYTDNKQVYINKGYFSFNTFYKALKNAVSKVGEEAPFILHFRISTQAGVRADCCHPYPLADSIKPMRKLKTTTSIGVAHNGIITLTSTHDAKIDYNDTMQFIADYLSLIIHNTTDLLIADNIKLINRLTNSKLAFLTSSGYVKMTGEGWIEEGEVYYSNASYKELKLNTVAYSGYYYSDSLFNEWEDYKTINEEYDFSEYYCPYTENYDTHYCSKCVNGKNCFEEV